MSKIYKLHTKFSLLEKANSHSENIIDSLAGIFLVMNKNFRILRGNVESTSAFDLPYEDLLGTSFKALFNDHTWSSFQHQFVQIEQDASRTDVKLELSIDT
jgi:hypothetical protein